jgi:hypothetical protein
MAGAFLAPPMTSPAISLMPASSFGHRSPSQTSVPHRIAPVSVIRIARHGQEAIRAASVES